GAQNVRGYVIDGSAEELGGLTGLYPHLASVIFGKRYATVNEDVLRGAVADLGILIAIYDCALDDESVTLLLRMFPRCRFLLTSHEQTLYRQGSTYLIEALAPQDALRLLTEKLQEAQGLENLQRDEARQLTDGKPQNILRFAAFLVARQAAEEGAERAGQ